MTLATLKSLNVFLGHSRNYWKTAWPTNGSMNMYCSGHYPQRRCCTAPKYNNVSMHFLCLLHRCTSKQPRWPSPWAWAPQCPLGCSTCQRCTWFSSTPSRMCPSAHAASRQWLLLPLCPTNSTPSQDWDPMEKPRLNCVKASRHKVRAWTLIRQGKIVRFFFPLSGLYLYLLIKNNN